MVGNMYCSVLDTYMPEMSTDQDWIGLKPFLAGSGLDRTAIFMKILDQDWIGLRKFLMFLCDYSKHIKTFSCYPIRFYRFTKWQCIFCHQWQKLCWEYFAIRTVSTFVHI